MKNKTVDSSEVVELLAKYATLSMQSRGVSVRCLVSINDLSILHSIVCFGRKHSQFQDLGPEGEEVAGRFRDFFKSVLVSRGLSPDEADMLEQIKSEFDEVI